MIIKVKVQGATITISCGNGRQTFRWLGSVVQARIKQYGVLKNRYEEDNYIVTEIRNGNDQLINPADLLLEHAGSGTLEVTAIVTSHFPVDEWEIPEMGDWLKGAHVKSKIGSQWMSEIEAWRGSLQNMKDATNRGEGQESNVLLHRAQPQTSNLIQIGFDFTESDINSAFDLDWSVMKWDWLQPTELLKNQLGDVLKRNYASVCNLFAHYCGVGQGTYNVHKVTVHHNIRITSRSLFCSRSEVRTDDAGVRAPPALPQGVQLQVGRGPHRYAKLLQSHEVTREK